MTYTVTYSVTGTFFVSNDTGPVTYTTSSAFTYIYTSN